jgi:hypothetical protein
VEPQSDDQDINEALAAWRESIAQASDCPEWFWSRQRARIASSLGAQTTRLPKMVWAGSIAVIVLASTMLVTVRTPEPVAPSTSSQVELSDHELMLALERSMNAGAPSSLAPGTVLAQEMDRALQPDTQTQNSKERKYED